MHALISGAHSDTEIPLLSRAQLRHANVGFQPLGVPDKKIGSPHVELVGTQDHSCEIQPHAVRVLVANGLRQDLLMGIALKKLTVVYHLIWADLVPDDGLVLASVKSRQTRKNALRKPLATHLQRVLDVEQGHGFGGFALAAVSRQEQTERTRLNNIMTFLKLG